MDLARLDLARMDLARLDLARMDLACTVLASPGGQPPAPWQTDRSVRDYVFAFCYH